MYYLVGGLLLISLIKSREKTIKALKKAWKSLGNILPKFLGVIILVGLMLSIFDEEVISSLIGSQSGVFGVVIAAVIGSITLIPGFVAFPTAKTLIEGGAGYTQVAVFVSTLMMVGVMTFPVEIMYFGKKITIIRNILALVLSILVGIIVGKVASGLWL